MSKEVCSAPKKYTRPMVLSTQSIRFETAHSWNPGKGNQVNPGGNLGVNFPSSNPNPTPAGAGTPGNGNGNGKANGKNK